MIETYGFDKFREDCLIPRMVLRISCEIEIKMRVAVKRGALLNCSRDAKRKQEFCNVRDWFKSVSKKIRREQVGTVPTFFLFALTNLPSGKRV